MKNLLLIYYPRGEIYYLPARHAATAASDNRQISVFHPRMMPSLRRARHTGYSALGTGIRDMIERCQEAGLPEPDFSVSDGFMIAIRRPAATAGRATVQVTAQDKLQQERFLSDLAAAFGLPAAQAAAQVSKVLTAADSVTGRSRDDLQAAADITHREHYRKAYLEPLVAAGWLERTIPDKPTSPNQKYRLTAKGLAWLGTTKEETK